jgi:hypothetical protein
MEQRFSMCHGPQNEDIDMNNPTTLGDVGQPSSPCAKPQSGTVNHRSLKHYRSLKHILVYSTTTQNISLKIFGTHEDPVDLACCQV